MNANQLLNMVTRLLMRRVVGKGVDAGINAASRAVSKRGGTGQEPQGAPNPQVGETAKRAKQAMRVTRRMGRF
ncbi:hypothetical protein C8N32_102163 [Rhodovulum imhoffii]|uniref:Uncharacterized protein n=1 Tax=Rhodovulum imhoffii TaxID=365340 RepID=A0A2T5BVM8_9RHOB|nr:hypothetical protein [Rhodovulum imhoffii]MBK5932795.1 hypothetical protein [Rhodovulum imhoffii]PTN03636.1 hypothetical protein C8N32_102163 [Rhodovulum imhoffii]